MERQRGLLGRAQSRFWEGHCPEPFPRVGSTEPWSQPQDVRGPAAMLSSKPHTGDSPLPPGRPRRGCSCPGCPDPNPHPEPSVSQQPGPQQLLLPPLLLQPESAWEDRALGQSLNPVSEGEMSNSKLITVPGETERDSHPTQSFGWTAVHTFTPALVHSTQLPGPALTGPLPTPGRLACALRPTGPLAHTARLPAHPRPLPWTRARRAPEFRGLQIFGRRHAAFPSGM